MAHVGLANDQITATYDLFTAGGGDANDDARYTPRGEIAPMILLPSNHVIRNQHDPASVLSGTNLTSRVTDTHSTDLEITVQAVIIACMAVIGSINNVLVLLASLQTPKLRQQAHLLVLNMAVVDLVVTGVFCPLYAYGIVRREWVFGPAMCSVAAYIIVQNVGVSIVTHFAIAVNRYINAQRNAVLFSDFLCSTRAVVLGILLIWISVFLLQVVPYLCRYVALQYQPAYGMCICSYRDTRRWFVFHAVSYGVGLVLPFVGAVFCYYKVYRIVHGRMSFTRSTRARQRYVRSCKRMSVLFIVFCVCWLPEALHVLADPKLEAPVFVTRILFFALIANSALNPFVYAWKFQMFRTTVKALFTGKRVSRYSQSAVSVKHNYTKANSNITTIVGI